ncbi:MAG: hypothetical protein A2V99_08180 [Spirochaetes bacterium RBG_16_67_19]|nr:MAG: hypothetical protein A2064_04820 [Spirochaetes bacterium GWB1_66_5]OHD74399.1 MAG: hypothetical protein A2V99_08180 [Spirochaetes bacterium RBG_16_67_19]
MIAAEDKEAIRAIMRHVVWDYDVDPYDLYEVAVGKRGAIGHFSAERVLLRMLERLSWYDVLDLLGTDRLRTRLTTLLIARIRHDDVRERYEYVRRLLQGEALPLSGWDPASRAKVRDSLLSDRWYRAEQALVRP